MSAKKCQKCGECCYSYAGPFVFPQDVERISRRIGMPPAVFLTECCIQDNLNIAGADLYIYSIKAQNGKCLFLNERNLCTIFEFKPYQCENAPFHFLAKYDFWNHMKCITPEDFEGVDSAENDKQIFSTIIDPGYKQYLGGA